MIKVQFYNKTFDALLKKYSIEIYHTFNEGKAVIVERFNRKLKSIMYKYLTANNTHTYINNLDKIVNKYNNTIHSSIKMKPKLRLFKKILLTYIMLFIETMNLSILTINLILVIK